MFIFFKDDVFKDFWMNNKGDIFFEATCKGLKWNPQTIDLAWYDIDSIPEFFNFDENKNLIILEKKTREVINEQTQEITTEEYFNDLETKQVEFYVQKGSILTQC